MKLKNAFVVFVQGLAIAMIGTGWAQAEQALLENVSLLRKHEIVDASHAWLVTDVGLKRLRSVWISGEVDFYVQNKVRVLKLDGTRITDAGLKHLEGKNGLIALEEISLANTRISDAGLESLAGLKRLRRVNLGRTLVVQDGVVGVRVTDAGVKQLKKALPGCRVEHQRVVLELSDTQREQFKLWSAVAEPRLDNGGDLIALLVRHDAKLSRAHHESLPKLKHLAELHAAGKISAEGVMLLPALTNLRKLSLRGCPLSDDAIAPLEKLTTLQVLDLAHTQLTDHGLNHLSSLNMLVAIDMRGTDVRTRGLQSLRKWLPNTEFAFDPPRVLQLPHQWLTVNDRFELTRVGGHIGRLKSHKTVIQDLTRLLGHPSLEQLDLRHCETLRDDDLKIVAKMMNLRDLDMGCTRITSTGVQHLAELKRLKKLNLWSTSIPGDGGLSALEDLMGLESLTLQSTSIDDTALPILARISSLSYVDLRNTRITHKGLARLQQTRPNMVIESNPKK